ncbi:MAG TPA: polysaccharide biosynthesis tyrosine autokinase, partial [Flavobacteriaceae bacterium]|nr:polysaccharide biosynthesis tyrosine autokinase [Flavobacteriaceae bacterium]
DHLKERAELLINSLIRSYNKESKDDGTKLAVATSDFINERLKLIENDLKNVDKNLADYKTANKLNNTEMESGAFLQNALTVDQEVVELNAQLEVAEHLIKTLEQSTTVLLPSNVGIQDPALTSAINSYNQLVLEKQEYSKSMREDNPAMITLNQNIANIKEGIQGSLSLYRSNLTSSLKIVNNKKSNLNEKLQQLPAQELGFRNIARQQQIVEAIYLFLLQKREEAEIKASATVDVLKVVDEAYGTNIPVTPKRNIIYLGSFLVGLFIPFAILNLKFILNNTIKDKTDFKEVFNGAFLGDIPTSPDVIINDNDRSSLAESFRIIRSNLNFILPKNNDSKVIYITSTVAGEGKTFTAVNLSQILSLTKKKVILVGADVRAPKILDYLDLSNNKRKQGLTDFIINEQLKTTDIIMREPGNYAFDVLSAGSLPPNPSELLMDERFSLLLQELKNTYDFVIVDTAPVGMVSDTVIIAEHADATLFVARSNFLDKRLTGVLEDMYVNKKLKNIALLINDVDYNRGYRYGYGYGYGETKKKKWWQRK